MCIYSIKRVLTYSFSYFILFVSQASAKWLKSKSKSKNPHQQTISSVDSKRTLVCRFKFLSLLQQDWFCLDVFIVHQLDIFLENDSNDIVSLCLYRYSCGVDCYSLTLRMNFRTISLSLLMWGLVHFHVWLNHPLVHFTQHKNNTENAITTTYHSKNLESSEWSL